MHMASEAIQCEFGIIVGKLLLALEVAKCRHRSTHGARRQEPPDFRRFLFWGEGDRGRYILLWGVRACVFEEVWYNEGSNCLEWNMVVKVKKLMDSAVMPKYGTEFSAGADLVNARDSVVVEAGKTVIVHTGIAMEIPVGYVGLVHARSGMATKRGLAPANKVGVIDSDYRGEIMVALHNHGDEAQTVESGERVAQIIIAPYVTADFVEGDLDDTVRGDGGFGSTGRK